MTYTLPHALSDRRRGLTRRARHRSRIQQIRLGPLESKKPRRIDTLPQVDPHRPHRRSIPDPKADRMYHIVEVAVAPLVHSKRHLADAGIDVPHIVEEYAADILP